MSTIFRTTASKQLLIVTALLLTASVGVQAQSTTYGTGGAAALSVAGNSYVGIKGGPSEFTRLNSGSTAFPHDDHTTGYGVEVGNYLPGQNTGVELSYIDFGKVSRAGGTTKANGVSLSLIGRLPLNDTFNLIGKIGTTYGNTDVSADATSGIASGSESGFDWSYGIGAELLINPQWSAVVQYSEHFMKFAGSGSERMTATTLGVRMRF